MNADTQLITIILAFLITALIIDVRRQSSGGTSSNLQDRIDEMDRNLQRLIALVGVVQNQKGFYFNVVMSSSGMSPHLMDRAQKLRRMIAELERQITARGGENYAPPYMMVQLQEYKDELHLVESRLDERLEQMSQSEVSHEH